MQVRGLGGALHDALSACVDGGLIDPYLSIQLCAARYGTAESLEHIERQIQSYSRDTVAPIAGAHVALVSATLARRRGTPGIAQKLGRSAAAAYRRFGWRLHEAMALELAGDPEDAGKTYRACGAGADVARIAAGQSRKAGRAPFGASLTPREREVARLVARRRSDREIAHALELSVRTVHHHVEAIFSKLGVKRRVQITEGFLDEPHAR
jgi:DNA-binding CsgD family transcriptional regulator